MTVRAEQAEHNKTQEVQSVVESWAPRGSAADLIQVAGILKKDPGNFADEIGLDRSLLDEAPISPEEKMRLAIGLRSAMPLTLEQPDLSTEEGKSIALVSGITERAINATTVEYDDLVWEHSIRGAMKIFSRPGLSKAECQESWRQIHGMIGDYERLVIEASRKMTEIAEQLGLKDHIDIDNLFLWSASPTGAGYVHIWSALYNFVSDSRVISKFGLSKKTYLRLYNNPLKCADFLRDLHPPTLELNDKNLTDLVNALSPSGFPQCTTIEDLKKANIYVYPIDGQYPVSYVLFDRQGNHKMVALIPKNRAQRVVVAHELGHLFTFWQLIEKEGWSPAETFFIPYSYHESVGLITQQSFPGITDDEKRLNAIFYLIQRPVAALFMSFLWESRISAKGDEDTKEGMRGLMMNILRSRSSPELWALLATRTGFMTLYDFSYTFASNVLVQFMSSLYDHYPKDEVYNLRFIRDISAPDRKGIRGG